MHHWGMRAWLHAWQSQRTEVGLHPEASLVELLVVERLVGEGRRVERRKVWEHLPSGLQ